MSSEKTASGRADYNFLGKEFYVILTRPIASREQIEPLLGAHLDNQVRLEKEGTMFAAGPLFDESGERVGGMFVIRANSLEAAKRIADADPLHAAGLRDYTIRRWIVNEGSYSVRVNYSDQSVQID